MNALEKLMDSYWIIKDFDKEDYFEIFDLLINTNWSMREIGRYVNRHHDIIEKIKSIFL